MRITDQYIPNAANGLGNPRPLDIGDITAEQIMAERGVTKRRAYVLLRRIRTEAEATPVPDNQRERMLSYLFRTGGSARNTNELREGLHADGFATDGHDVVKVLWSLQKTGHVQFRERQKPKMLYKIHLTEAGMNDARALPAKANGSSYPGVTLDARAEADLRADAAERAWERTGEPPDEPEVVENPVTGWHQEAEAEPAEDVIELPAPNLEAATGWGTLGGYPVLRALRERAKTAAKLTAAAKLLEEAGEDDLALAIMGKTEFSDLESEIIALLNEIMRE